MEPPEDEVALEIARARVEARRRAEAAGTGRQLPAFAAPEAPVPPPRAAPSPPADLPAPPDASAVNESWRPPSLEGGGLVGVLRRLVDRLVRRQLAARVRFDADQVRFDNDLLAYVTAHLAATHRHYDRLIARSSVRMDEIDERHLQAQQQVCAAIEGLARRVDLVLEAAERSRVASEADLWRLASRLEALEQLLGQRERATREPDE